MRNDRDRSADIVVQGHRGARFRKESDTAEERPRGRRGMKLLIAALVGLLTCVATEEFQSTLEQAVDDLHAGGADVVFMNMQYSPRTDAVLPTEAYGEALRWVGLERGVNLFDRQAVMRQWSELGTFDLLTATKSLDTAAQVHDCIGRLLAT